MPRDLGDCVGRDSHSDEDGGPAALEAMTPPGLAARWAALHGAPPPPAMTARLLRLALAWEMQARTAGPAAKRVARRLDRLSIGAPRGDPPRAEVARQTLKPGTTFVRDWGGRTYRVEALAGGRFAWEGREWRSLSAIAREITGTRRNGPAFFGLREAKPDGDA